MTVRKLMSEKNTGSIVITDNDMIVGIITERGLIKLVCAEDLQASKDSCRIYYVSSAYCHRQKFDSWRCC